MVGVGEDIFVVAWFESSYLHRLAIVASCACVEGYEYVSLLIPAQDYFASVNECVLKG